MNFDDFLGGRYSDDADFDDIEDYEYLEGLIDDDDEDEDYEDEDEFFDEDEEEDDEDRIEYGDGFLSGEKDIKVQLVCEDCGHHWVDYLTEEDNDRDFVSCCPMCGSDNVSSGH